MRRPSINVGRCDDAVKALGASAGRRVAGAILGFEFGRFAAVRPSPMVFSVPLARSRYRAHTDWAEAVRAGHFYGKSPSPTIPKRSAPRWTAG